MKGVEYPLCYAGAVAIMLDGDCCARDTGPDEVIYRCHKSELEFWNMGFWLPASNFPLSHRWRIVPDPSKPKEKSSDEAWCALLGTFEGCFGALPNFAEKRFYRALIDFVKAEIMEELNATKKS